MSSFEEWAARSTRLPVDGLSVALYDSASWGDADPDDPVLTYCHGYPSSTHDIEPVWERLGGWRLVAIDLIGFGASDKPRGDRLTIHRQADAVEAAWRELGVASTVLQSHDYGVSVGQELLARRAEGGLAVDVTAAVWHNGGLYPDLHRPTVGQQLLRDPDHGAEVAASMTEELFRSGIEVTWGERVPLTDEVVHEMWVGLSRDGGSAMAHELLHYMDDRKEHADRWRGALERSGLPMTFVWGDLDPVSGAHVMERLRERMPDATLLPLADVGHWPTLEAPDEVAAAVESHRPDI
ncbi:alpha/beta fold hydrolase [Dermatobacter hominis]|uniref:alpha/beta fold hydrolase n=1 Tax=Dermatobacter hominis TaxID=2884263 RepID=UPI001D12CAE7|nr:alpha/beta hydrolase [Dermatobacter hominis]UDY37585.1 alpha/beta hydrolase [Dermatobacter hominis]